MARRLRLTPGERFAGQFQGVAASATIEVDTAAVGRHDPRRVGGHHDLGASFAAVMDALAGHV